MRSLSFVAAGSVAALLVSLASVAHAQTWTEVGDAGQTIATVQTTVGSGPLTTIFGTVTPEDDADVYCIHLDGDFSATTVGGANFDTILALFDSSGNLLLQNDDSFGTVQSTISGSFAPGNYLIGISSFANFAFSGPTYGGIAPGFDSGPYAIALTGATFCVTDVPEPGAYATAAMLFGGLSIGLVRGRRKKA